MDVGDAAGEAVLAGEHAEIGLAVADGFDGALEGGAGERGHAGEDAAAGEVGVRPRDPLKRDHESPFENATTVVLRLAFPAGDFLVQCSRTDLRFAPVLGNARRAALRSASDSP